MIGSKGMVMLSENGGFFKGLSYHREGLHQAATPGPANVK